jgi:hypothetical protein
VNRFAKGLAALVILGGLASLAWTASFLYWHLKILSALRTLERDTVLSPPSSPRQYDVPPGAMATLQSAGCRALPYLIASIDASKPPPFLAAATSQLVATLNRGPALTKEDCDIRSKRREELRIDLEDPPELRARKCARNKEWWSLHGSDVHQWWRSWSRCCVEE